MQSILPECDLTRRLMFHIPMFVRLIEKQTERHISVKQWTLFLITLDVHDFNK